MTPSEPPPSEPPPSESATAEPIELSSENPHSLHQAVHARRSEYVRPHRIRVKIGTWNVAACPGTDKDLARWFVDGKGLDVALGSLDIRNNPAVEADIAAPGRGEGNDGVHLLGGDKIGLYVLGLQEIVDLNTATQYMARVYAADNGPMDKWKAAMESALPDGYQLVTAEQLTGMLLLMYASPDVAASISNVSTVTVGTGLLGYLGNKGAVVTRIILGETTRMVFINSHLASGQEASYVERRIWDVGQILTRAQFQPISFAGVSEDEGEKIGDEDFAFWFGDLNFRLDGLPGDDIRRILMLHTRGEYDLSKKGLPREDSLEGEGVVVQKSADSSDEEADEDPGRHHSRGLSNDDSSRSLPDPDEFLPDPSSDPASLQATLDSLLPHDQLTRMIKERKVFHDGWHEGPITFLPSYKYDVGTVGLFDSSEKRRAPSWCDRILYRTRRDKEAYDKRVEEEEEARKKDEEMKARGMDHAGDDDEVLFSYDPDNDGEEVPGTAGLEYDEYEDDGQNDLERVVTKEGFVDRIHLDIYTSHQRISSSDHKPIISIFTLDYDAVVPDLRAKVHAEVVRQLDRAENEGRPGITIVVDSNESSPSSGVKEPSGLLADLGEIRFLKKATANLTLANTGGVPAKVSFVEKPTTEEVEGPGPSSWLTTSFVRPEAAVEDGAAEFGKEVTLEPGETVNALLEAFVGEIQQARWLNDGQILLEEVLVLRVADGRDYFVPVRGSWSPTCIGRSMDELIRVPDGGVKKFAEELAHKRGRPGSISYDLDVRFAAPKELFKLTEAVEVLIERALADEQMLEECAIPKDPGWPFDESSWTVVDQQLRDARVVDLIEVLDQDKAIADAFLPETSSLERLEAVSEVLLLFLRALTDGVVTTPLWNRIEQASLPSIPGSTIKQPPEDTSEDDKTTILDILATAPNHNIAFVFLTAMLAKILSELSPITRSELDALKSDDATKSGGVLGRRSLSFRKAGATPALTALAALDRRKARERRYAQIFGKVICRPPAAEKEKDKRVMEDRQRAVVELFLRRVDVQQ